MAIVIEWVKKNLLAKGSIRRDALEIYLLQFFTLGVGLIASIAVARTLGPAKKGIIDLFSLLSSFIVDFGLMGFGSGLLYYLANRGKSLGEVHGTGVAFSLAAGLLTAVVGWIGMPAWKALLPGLYGWIILLAFVLAPFRYYGLIWSNIMMGLNKAVSSYRISFTLGIGNVLAILGLWASGRMNVESLIGLMVFFVVLNGAVTFGMLYRFEPRLSSSGRLMRDSLGYGIVAYIGVIANVLHFKVDQVMINYWLGTKEVGLYTVGVRWAESLFLLDSAIGAAALYRISSSSPEESYRLSKKIFKGQLLISCLSGIALALLAKPLILILYGEQFRESVWPLILLIPGIVAWSVGKIMSQYLSYNRGKVILPTLFAVMGMAVNIVMNFYFIQWFGISGAAAASSLSYCFVVLLTIFAFRRMRAA